MTPKDSHSTPIPLPPMQKPRILSLPQPLSSGRHLTASMKATSHLETCRLSEGPVLWNASLVASLKRGWRPGRAGWSWVRNAVRPSRRLWVLLDASRSTGAAAFLARAREAIAGLLHGVRRASLLLIHNNTVAWPLRNASPRRTLEALSAIPAASGGSPIAGAIRKLGRAVAAGRLSRKDTVCLCSDGLPTLQHGQTAAQAAEAVRSALRHLRRNTPSPALWLCPSLGRGAAAWLQRVTQDTGCQVVQMPLK
jgi:Mg-chelatase subunit ChlD